MEWGLFKLEMESVKQMGDVSTVGICWLYFTDCHQETFEKTIWVVLEGPRKRKPRKRD